MPRSIVLCPSSDTSYFRDHVHFIGYCIPNNKTLNNYLWFESVVGWTNSQIGGWLTDCSRWFIWVRLMWFLGLTYPCLCLHRTGPSSTRVFLGNQLFRNFDLRGHVFPAVTFGNCHPGKEKKIPLFIRLCTGYSCSYVIITTLWNRHFPLNLDAEDNELARGHTAIKWPKITS